MTCHVNFIWLIGWETHTTVHKSSCFDRTGINFRVFNVFDEHDFDDERNDNDTTFKVFNDNVFLSFVIFLFDGDFLVGQVFDA